MMHFISLVVRESYCCDLALHSIGEERGPRHSTPHPRNFYSKPLIRAAFLLSQVHLPEDIGQGEGCEGGKCEVRR